MATCKCDITMQRRHGDDDGDYDADHDGDDVNDDIGDDVTLFYFRLPAYHQAGFHKLWLAS